MDRRATTDEDRAVATGGLRATLAFVTPRARRVPRLLQRRREPDALVHPALALGTARPARTSTGSSTRPGRHYETVNRLFADAVVVELDNKPDAAVLFQDYHLYLAPGFVRDARPDAKLAHFVHIPWPVDWTTLPRADAPGGARGTARERRRRVPHGAWARHFDCELVRRSSADCGRTRVTHHPISIDTAEFDELARDTGRAREEGRDRRRRGPSSSSLRVDRTDPSKNIVRGFEAFERLPRQPSRVARRVTMLALLDPSRQAIPEYVDYLAAIERTARESTALRHAGLEAVDLQSRTTSRVRLPPTSSSTCCS